MAYKFSLGQFVATCKKRYVSEVQREDLLEYIRYQYKVGCAPRTAYNRVNILVTFLKLHGITRLLKKFDWPAFVDSIRAIYEPEELTALFAACNPLEHLLFSAYLLSGFHEKEIMSFAKPYSTSNLVFIVAR
jgi:hypothetical protein